ncbi:hypothetical protein M422DRAFT_49225 [Sphaerobolus stellatus SS14]|uniref:Extracellular membrane protein CFEM domain-containing protein n=1 Tax=Sphaerobolus stellatus (strain SS14) TaxID=990650 RepID=A0A0C9UAW4_SPHS4|nr:hypothetical protein M422DRAFT_49225 [Sphaerobolus stellatus SS14]
MIALTFLFGLLFTIQVMSSPAPHTPSFDVSIFARQAAGSLPTVTGPCASPCEALTTNTEKCSSANSTSTADDAFNCLCSSDYSSSLVQCAQCVVNQAGSTDAFKQAEENALQSISPLFQFHLLDVNDILYKRLEQRLFTKWTPFQSPAYRSSPTNGGTTASPSTGASNGSETTGSSASGTTGSSASGTAGTKSGSGSTGSQAGNGAVKLSLTGTVALLGLFAIGFSVAGSV